MKKILLLTTALIGNLLILGSVQAQTTITGEMKIAFKSSDGFSNAATNSGFTSEKQINIANKGKLNNGLDYAAGFSIELEGDPAGTGYTDAGEGNYFNIIAGNTTVTLGMDHILNGDYAIVPRAGAPMNEEIAGIGGLATTSVRSGTRTGLQYAQSLGDNNELFGLGVVQTIPSIGRVAVNFVPKSDDAAKVGDTATPSASGKSAYSAFFVGDLGVKGLQVALEIAQNEKNDASQLVDQRVTAFGASYTMGDFSIGAERQKFTDHSKAETETTEFGLTYKINNNASAGIGTIKTEGKNVSGVALTLDEEIKYLQIGYNLGGYSAQVSVIDVEKVEFVDTKDSKAYVFKLATKF
jgi:hypothetical protein